MLELFSFVSVILELLKMALTSANQDGTTSMGEFSSKFRLPLEPLKELSLQK